MTSRSRVVLTTLLSASVSLCGSYASAQAPAAPGPSEYMVLVPPRDLAAIDEDIMAADADLAEAIAAESAAAARRVTARADVASKKAEIADVKRQRDNAKGPGNEATVTALDLSKKALERELVLLEQRSALNDAEIELARQTNELAALERQMHSFERELAIKRVEEADSAASGPQRSSLRRVVLDLEGQTLNARVTHADKAVDVASRQKKVAERLLKILEAQRRLVVN